MNSKKYVLKPINALKPIKDKDSNKIFPKIINCDWYKLFIKILFTRQVTVTIFEDYITETGIMLKKETEEKEKCL